MKALYMTIKARDEHILVRSERLLIRRTENEDQAILEQLFCNPEMMDYLGGTWTSDKVREALQEWHQDWGINNRWYGVLLRKDTSEPIGTAGVTENTIPGEPGLELSWFVLPPFQRKGFATEITEALIRFAFDDLGAQRMLAETHPQNPASNQLLENMGFKCLGERKHQYDDLPGFDTQMLWELMAHPG
jgi:[ribosomal protein S5]-alanine N-acetyltransferase